MYNCVKGKSVVIIKYFFAFALLFNGVIASHSFFDCPNSNAKVMAKADIPDGTYLKPIAKYDFDDSFNIGKDTYGKYNLEVSLGKYNDQPSSNFVPSQLSVENGVLHCDGSTGLLAVDNARDVSERLTSFSLCFDIALQEMPSAKDWFEPIGFGWNDWSGAATKWATFMIGKDSDLLRFSCANNPRPEDDMHSDIDGNQSAWWGKPITNLGTDRSMHRITLTAQADGKVKVYVDGVVAYNYDCPEDFSLADPTMRFCIGANGNWGSTRYGALCDIAHVEIYPNSMNDEQAVSYYETGLVDASLSDVKYLKEIKEGIIFKDNKVSKLPIDSGMDDSTLFQYLNDAHVEGVMSDNSEVELPIEWVKVARKSGKCYAIGNISINGMPTAVVPNQIEYELVLESAKCEITLALTTNGTASLSTDRAEVGEEVIITVTPDEGYVVDYVSVDGDRIEPVNGIYSFIAEWDCVVRVYFKVAEEPAPQKSGCRGANMSVVAATLLTSLFGLVFIRKKIL